MLLQELHVPFGSADGVTSLWLHRFPFSDKLIPIVLHVPEHNIGEDQLLLVARGGHDAEEGWLTADDWSIVQLHVFWIGSVFRKVHSSPIVLPTPL